MYWTFEQKKFTVDFIPKSKEGYFFFDLLNKQVNRKIQQRGTEYEALAFIAQVSKEERVIKVTIIQGVLQLRCVLSDTVLYSIIVSEILSLTKAVSVSRGPGWAKVRIATEKSDIIPSIKIQYKNALMLEKTCKKLKCVPKETLQIEKSSKRTQFSMKSIGASNEEKLTLEMPVHRLISAEINSEVEIKMDLQRGMISLQTAEGACLSFDHLSIYQYCYNETNQSLLLTARKGKLLAMHRLIGSKEKVQSFHQNFQMFLEYNYRVNSRPNPFQKAPVIIPVEFNSQKKCLLEIDPLSNTLSIRNLQVLHAQFQDSNQTYFYDIESMSKVSVTPTNGIDHTLALQSSSSEQCSLKFGNKKNWNFVYNFVYSKKVVPS